MKKIIFLVLLISSFLFSEEPYWYSNPNIDGKIVATGIASNVYPNIAHDLALKSALSELAHFSEIDISSLDKIKQGIKENNHFFDYSSETSMLVDVFLNNITLENIERVGYDTYVRISIDKNFTSKKEDSFVEVNNTSLILKSINKSEEKYYNAFLEKLENAFEKKYNRKFSIAESYKVSKIINITEYKIDKLIAYIAQE